MQERKTQEHEDIATFLGQRESTMAAPVSNSVGMAILVLQKEYFNKITEKDMELEREKCLKELQEIKDEDYQPAIRYILEKIKEPPNELDRVTLYLPVSATEYKDEKFEMPLKDVLPLVWRAIHDHKKFMHAYPEAKDPFDQAKADFPARLKNFLNCLENIRTAQVCHHVIAMNSSSRSIKPMKAST